jgi:hypothetical protein
MNPDNQANLAHLISEQLGPEFASFVLDEDFGPVVDELSSEDLRDLARQAAQHIRYAKSEGFLDRPPDTDSQ